MSPQRHRRELGLSKNPLTRPLPLEPGVARWSPGIGSEHGWQTTVLQRPPELRDERVPRTEALPRSVPIRPGTRACRCQEQASGLRPLWRACTALDINSFTPVRMLADCVGMTEVLQYERGVSRVWGVCLASPPHTCWLNCNPSDTVGLTPQICKCDPLAERELWFPGRPRG